MHIAGLQTAQKEIQDNAPYTPRCEHVPTLVLRIRGRGEASIKLVIHHNNHNPTHINYFPSLLWSSGHITPQAYNLKSTEFRDLPPGIRDKGRAEGLPNFRYRERVAQDLCGCHLSSWGFVYSGGHQ